MVVLLADPLGQRLHPLHECLAKLLLHVRRESYGGNLGRFLE